MGSFVALAASPAAGGGRLPCAPATVAGGVERFFSAYSGGDWRPLRKLLAPVGPGDLDEDAKDGAYGFRGYADAFQLRAATGSDPMDVHSVDAGGG